MDRQPHDSSAGILTARRLARVVASGAVMAAGTLGVLWVGIETTSEDRALALAFTTFVLFQVFNVFNVRSENASVFRRESLRNGKLWVAVGAVVALQALAVHVEPVQSVFDTVDFTLTDWLVAIGVASSILWIEELRKALGRRA